MVHFTLNGVAAEAEGGRSLLSYLRDEARLTAAKLACGEGVCGACSVLLDGAVVRSCTVPLERAEGKSVLTLEGFPGDELSLYERAFVEAGAVQCGYCTPGMVIAAKALLDANRDPSEAEIRKAIRLNLCRCTGYVKIVDAIRRAAAARAAADGVSAAGVSVAGVSVAGAAAGYSAHPRDVEVLARGGIGERLARVDAAVKA
ncbi:MAG TPA: (2Fe-2S)-binding protein, partial [bacterium]|nr:(2Fe-2S)-binding protein [bacterium]